MSMGRRSWQLVAAVAVVLLVAGSLIDHAAYRSWGVAAAILAACLWIRLCITELKTHYEAHMRRWASQPFEAGFTAGSTSERMRRS